MKRVLALITFCCLLTACGQKGPLYLPDTQSSDFTVEQGGSGS
ncbi:lipoprotein [Sansalvadorimonas sp. 2012CJ34-2]|uniref:Lipoprotein n=1 Tax=Parendozoicomonas callyspongiae TaxID=2942213 RepID=A0ABT0PLN8_9GAMM|nr:lipoprotein [Sansalvadorimonas sp. 2012CJ34-2]MCL6272161.1 lipoprotein [Sansalvadorimonas sp. 2012CJ34-2]